MRRKSRCIWALIASLVAPSIVLASGVALTGIGPRATALGGNYRALASDWSACYWNPAGLAQIQGLHAGFDVEWIKVRGYLTPANWDTLGRFSVFRQRETANRDKNFFVPAGGLVLGTGSLAVGLSVFAPFGLGATWDLLETESAFDANYPKFDYDDDLKVIDIHPTVAVRLNEGLYVGAGLSVVYSSMMIRKPGFIPNPYLNPPDPTLAAFVRVARFAENGLLSSPYTHFLVDTKLKGDGWGWGANLGAIWKATPTLSFGVSGQWYHDLELDGKVDAAIYFPNNPQAHQMITALVRPSLLQKLQRGEITQEQFLAVANAYSGQRVPVYEQAKGSATVPLPATVGVGVAYTGLPNTTLTADVSWTRWSSWDVIKIKMDNGDENELREQWKNTLRVGVGMERRLGSLRARLAYYTEPEAPPSTTLTPTIPDISRRHVVLAGLGIPVGAVCVNIHAEKFFTPNRTVDRWILAPDGTDYDNVAGKYRLTTFTVMVGVDYGL
ncbi:MAG: outer membrane protein transport protein [candidate division KSB1 bacterium]|nr:outer membrane protein transport protein [candidate division KSB1 bacterium]